jgi:hypothetical protein
MIYKNSFHNSKNQYSKEFIETENSPIEYKGFKIFHRIKSHNPSGDVFDIVKNDVCIGMNAGINGAKKRIDSVTNS